MKLLAALAISALILPAQTERTASLSVTAIRNWEVGDVTRIAVEVSDDFEFRTDRLHTPERVYFDILNSKPKLAGVDHRRIYAEELGGKLVQRVRIALTQPGITRIVLDLTGAVEISTSKLAAPYRLMIELRAGQTVIPTQAAPPITRPEPSVKADTPTPDLAPAPLRSEMPAVKPDPAPPRTPKVEESSSAGPPRQHSSPTPAERAAAAPAPPPVAVPVPIAVLEKPATETRTEVARTADPKPAGPPAPATPAELSKAARRTSTGGSSLTRALGLKIGRIVIDPGHGGHDQGTQGAKGLVEKELVLDVALRVGKLIEERMNAEVIYTRSDDTFIPLEGRTALANEKKADLFLSIHANSSPYPRIAGVETFYLNFTTSQDALDVASRENASSQKSVFELQDIIQKISLHEKVDESREFASRVQNAMFSFTSRNVQGEKNRGIKKAPFVVLIGANMPSILAEIGFLTNPREESQLKKSDYRQKLAEALFRGVSKYAESLSHFQVAQNSSSQN